jgi:hypothetical protein
MKKLSKKDLKAVISEVEVWLSERDPILGILLQNSSEIKTLDKEILDVYCSSREIPDKKINSLIDKLERLAKALKDASAAHQSDGHQSDGHQSDG